MVLSEIIDIVISYVKTYPIGSSLLGALTCSIIHQLYFYLRYIRKGAKKTTASLSTRDEQPGVSVVVCARNEEENLQDYLHTLATQDYPKYEVIVVDDGSEDNTHNILEQYVQKSNNLYHTFVPCGARVISSKKLALTIGIKAAKYDYILLTDADCRPESRYWIREMMSGFQSPKTELVLGFGPYFERKGLLNHLICYDTLFSGLQYMGMAKCGHPYMGVGRNMAYKRDTFFANSGFQGLLNTRAGDDDLFVNKVATKSNTNVVCNPDALTWSPAKYTWREWFHQKHRHLSVSHLYSTRNKLRISIEPFTRGLVYLLLICCIAYGVTSGQWIIGAAALGLWLIRLLTQLIVINVACSRFRMRGVGLGIILYDITLPLITLLILATKPKKRSLQIYW